MSLGYIMFYYYHYYYYYYYYCLLSGWATGPPRKGFVGFWILPKKCMHKFKSDKTASGCCKIY